MKLRSCDLSIIFFFAASHSPLKISQPPLKIPWPPPPPYLMSFVPESLIGEAVDQIMGVMNIL